MDDYGPFSNDLDEYDDDTETENSDRIEELESRIELLESDGSSVGETGISVVYALGMSIAVVLSWSRNGSILWCMLHGFLSWGYVIYFALTR